MEKTFSCLTNLRFVTIKSSNAKHWNIGYARKRMKSISDSFYVVREPNKKSEGYHFHFLCSLKKELKGKIPKRWFKKGIHHNVLIVRDTLRIIPTQLDEEYMDIMKGQQIESMREDGYTEDMITSTLSMKESIMETQRKIRKIKYDTKYRADIGRILNYMNKTLPNIEYVDYLYVINGFRTERDLTEGTPPARGGCVERRRLGGVCPRGSTTPPGAVPESGSPDRLKLDCH